MPSKIQVKYKDKGLDKIVEQLKLNMGVKIGLFAGIKDRVDSKGKSLLNNATIGLSHEFGNFSKGLPRRSFLVDTFTLKRDLFARYIGFIIGANLKDKKKALDEIGVAGENLVQKAFDTGGFGKWQALSPVTVAKKGFDQILVHTSQLKKGIGHKVERNK